jgi:hypothetical protein
MVDGDFVPSPGLYEYILSQSRRMHAVGNFTALVVPCFTLLDNTKWRVPDTITELLRAVKEGAVYPCGGDPDPEKVHIHSHMRGTNFDYYYTERERWWVDFAFYMCWA